MRIGEWARQWGVKAVPYSEYSTPKHGDTIWRVKDIFTTRDGSWEISNKPGSIEQWARDEYLRREFDDAGADHHIFGRLLGEDSTIHFWTYTDNANHTMQQSKPHSGWANIVMWASSSFVPERGERGPWAWRPTHQHADAVTGAGMPKNMHCSFFAVWEPTIFEGTVTPPPIEPPDPVLPPTDDNLAAQVAKNTADIARIKAWIQSFEGEI